MVKGQAGLLIGATLALSIGLSIVAVTVPFRIGGGFAQGIPTDPGMRTTGLFTSSTPFSTLSGTEFRNFGCPDGTISSCASSTASGAQGIFNQQWSVTGTVAGQPAPGLGPRYNANACFWCHGNPVPGGSSPAVNAEVAMASLNSRGSGFQANVVPATNYYAPDGTDGQPFIRSGGPTRASYQRSIGKQIQLYSIGGVGGPMMTDTLMTLPGCTSTVLPQPNYASLLGAGDISPLIPVPLFGVGLIEATPDANWRSQQNAGKFATYGIPTNTFNIGDTGTIAKIGWKGAISSVNYFASLALATEIGASSRFFPMKVDATAQCNAGAFPDDHPQLVARGTCSNCAMDFASAAEGVTYFATHLESPEPVWGTAPGAYDGPPPFGWSGSGTIAYGSVARGSVYNGYQQFVAVGCDTCHSPSHTTGPSEITGTGSKIYYNYGDRALHDMGTGMDNGITSGLATGRKYRTADLWGLGQRNWLNHDGRTNNLYGAIESHCTTGSEAAAVCSAFGNLSLQNQQDLINFLRGL
jgi:CxxC motif-containing protein (DUF1111 family)